MLQRKMSAVANSRLASIGVLVVAALLIGTGVVLARGADSPALQVPVGTAFTYQGTLTDGGLPADGQYDFQSEVYDDAGAGSQVGNTVILEDVQVTVGRFTVIIDFGVPACSTEALAGWKSGYARVPKSGPSPS